MNPRSVVDRAKAHLLDAIDYRRKAEVSRAENVFLAVSEIIPLIAFATAVLHPLL